MQANMALGLLETKSIARGVEAVDAMCKTAGVTVHVARPICSGKYYVIIKGPVGEVESSMLSGAEIAGETTVSQFIIRNVHKHVIERLDAKVLPETLDAFGMVETKDVVSAVYAADAACKAAFVHLVELRLGRGIGGKSFFAVCGEVGMVRTAVSAAVAVVPAEQLVTRMVLPQAHEAVLKAF
ncbi:MAG: BMC domain-containing protein [Elusimicrobiaceae bacterium]|jgi:microcompartment protein CcmL/EutN